MRKKKRSIIVLFIVLIVLGVIGWNVYPYVVVGLDYLNGEGSTDIGSEQDLGEIIMEKIESGKIQSDAEAVEALENISTDLTKTKKSLSTEEQIEVVTLAQQAIDSTLNEDEDYMENLNQLVEAYRALPSEEQKGLQLSVGKSINMRDYLTLKEKMDE